MVRSFQGARGDIATPVGSGPAILSPVLTESTQFWARVANSCGSMDSRAATITVDTARRHATHH